VISLATSYLGLRLSSPLVPSASPLSRTLDALRRMEDAGAGAVVLYSLFEEQIEQESHELDRFLEHGSDSHAEARSYFPEPYEFRLSPDQYLEHVRRAKDAIAIPVIGSLNGVAAGSWVRYAREIQEAGADALELNVYYLPADVYLPPGEIERLYVELVREVRRGVTIPLAVKLGPFFTNLLWIAHALAEAGADGLVLFNRFYQPDIDLDALEVVARAHLSTPDDPQALLLPLRWIAMLRGRIPLGLAATGGVHSHEDILKLLLVGADVTMLASALMLNGIDHLRIVRADLLRWMEEREYASVAQLRGSMSQPLVADPAAFERAHYARAVGTMHPPRLPWSAVRGG
jgi:dihydroorotate dehydrogenase (fumarate)